MMPCHYFRRTFAYCCTVQQPRTPEGTSLAFHGTGQSGQTAHLSGLFHTYNLFNLLLWEKIQEFILLLHLSPNLSQNYSSNEKHSIAPLLSQTLCNRRSWVLSLKHCNSHINVTGYIAWSLIGRINFFQWLVFWGYFCNYWWHEFSENQII